MLDQIKSIPLEERDTVFKEHLNRWRKIKDKKSYDIIFYLIYDCCLNIGKSKCYGLKVKNLEDKCLDATCNIMKRLIKVESLVPEKLSSYCYLWVIGQLWNPKYIKEEREYSFEKSFEKFAYIDDNGKYALCHENY